MSLLEEIDHRIRRWGLVHTKLAQAAAFFLALVLAKLFPVILDRSIWWFAVPAVVCALGPTLAFFRTRGARSPRM